MVAYNDLMALGVVEGLAAAGARVPRDMSVVGVDDTMAGRLGSPALTTVAMPTPEAGRAAVDLLLRAAGTAPGDTPADTVLPTSLVRRGSTAPPRGVTG